MSRYLAPKHVTGIHCPSGNEYRADEKGIVHVRKGAPDSDHAALTGAGFELLDNPAPKAPAAKPAGKAPAKAKAKPKSSAKPARAAEPPAAAPAE